MARNKRREAGVIESDAPDTYDAPASVEPPPWPERIQPALINRKLGRIPTSWRHAHLIAMRLENAKARGLTHYNDIVAVEGID